MKFLTIPEAADHAGVSRQAIWIWCRLNGIGQKVGRDWLVNFEKLQKHMEQRK